MYIILFNFSFNYNILSIIIVKLYKKTILKIKTITFDLLKTTFNNRILITFETSEKKLFILSS